MASEANFSSCALSISRSRRHAPSSNEYSVCRCKWTKSACDMATSYPLARTRGKKVMFTARSFCSRQRVPGPHFLRVQRVEIAFQHLVDHHVRVVFSDDGGIELAVVGHEDD